MEFNYGLLRERIKDEYKTLENFATAMDLGKARFSLMMNGKAQWNSQNIYKAAQLLGIEDQIGLFFFTPKFRK